MATEGWCRACGKWFRLGSNWKLPRHTWHDPRRNRDVRCSGTGKTPGKTRDA